MNPQSSTTVAKRPGRRASSLLLPAACALLTACATRSPTPAVRERGRSRELVLTPVVAVTAFDNRGGFASQWNVGEGMADLLSAALLDTESVMVVERKNIQDVLGELQRQESALFRGEGRVDRGRLRNARFVIRGTITDFTVIEGASGLFNTHWIMFGASRSKARVAIAMQLVDVENGDVLSVIKSDGDASAGGSRARINYKEVSFGGDSFFRTPLGEATEEAIDDAVSRLLRAIPSQPWIPMIAESGPAGVVINGGHNTRMLAGQVFDVCGPERLVTDPLTGNVISRAPGPATGRVQVTEVFPLAAQAKLLSGAARRGDRLRPPPALPAAER